MRIITHIAMFFYLAIITVVAGVAVSFAAHWIRFEEISYFLTLAYGNQHICLFIIVASVGSVLLSFFFSRVIIGVQKKERTIAFENPAGRVSISLSALEDMIKRNVLRVSDVKEIKSVIRATKKGIDVTCRLVLKAEGNIPETTLRIQELIKGRVQEILGLEENITVKLHIAKIFSQTDKERADKGEEPRDFSELSVPFKGYRK
ncbi:MAG: alkaline shock response membrane anchor protein AmaP [Candidatus Omnitrophota bacterium]